MNSPLIQELRKLKFAYLPYQPGGRSPADRRRFPTVGQMLELNWEFYVPGRSYDVLYATSNADLTALRRRPRSLGKVAFDMVDSYFDVPDWDPKALVRGAGKWALKQHEHLEIVYRRTLEGMCRRADLIVCSMPGQQSRMSMYNTNIHPILDLPEETGFIGPERQRKSGAFQIFWEGLGLSASQFAVIAPVLETLSDEYKIAVHFVTDSSFRPWNFPVPVLSTVACWKGSWVLLPSTSQNGAQ